MTLHHAAVKAYLASLLLSYSTCAGFFMLPSRQLCVRTLIHSNAQAWSALHISLSDDEVYDDTNLYSYEDNGVSDYYDEEGTQKKKQKKWVKPTVLAVPVVLAALFRLTSGCSLATRVTVSGAFVASIVWRRRRRTEADNQEEYTEVLHEEKTVQENRWVNTRLSEAQQREQAEDEARRAVIANQRAAQMESARHWAASTLEHTTQLQQEVEERRKQEALAREQAANWLESTSTLAGIDLHGGGMGGDDEDADGIENWNQDPPDRATMWLESTSNLAGIDLTGGGDTEERIDDRMEEDQY